MKTTRELMHFEAAVKVDGFGLGIDENRTIGIHYPEWLKKRIWRVEKSEGFTFQPSVWQFGVPLSLRFCLGL